MEDCYGFRNEALVKQRTWDLMTSPEGEML